MCVLIHTAKFILIVHQMNQIQRNQEDSKCFLSSFVCAANMHVVFL